MVLVGYELTLECDTCGLIWTRNTRDYPNDDQAPCYRTGPCCHDVHTIKNIVDIER